MNAKGKTSCVVRIGCVLVAFLSCSVSLAMTLPDQEWERIDLDDDHTTIEASDKSRRSSAIPTETAGDLEIPSVLRGFRVVSLGKQAFYGCAQLTSVTIPEGVTNIADQAFYNCSSLTNVVFPTTLKSIGASAFIGCQKLASINIEAPRLTIGDRAFRNCDGLQTIRFVGDELIIATRAFFGCGGLRDVNLSVKDITLSEGAFSGGYDPSPNQYGYCDHLTNVLVVASNRVGFGASVFRGCSSLRQVILTAGAELNVGSTAFVDCSALQQVTLTAGAGMSVGSTAFSGCTALRQTTMTAGAAINLGASAFSVWKESDSVTHSSCNHLTNVLMVASNRVGLGESAFSSCTALQTIELPKGLVGVPTNAFNSCTALQSISLSSNVASIAYRAFDTCTSLRSVELAEGLQTIDAQAFYGCTALEELRVPQSVSQIGDRAFERCDGLGRLVFCEGDTNTPAAASVSVGERAFYRNGSLTNVVFSQAVTDLGVRAFAECSSLTSVNLPTNLVEVSESLFEFCEQLSAIDLPPGLTAIGSSAFNACSSLASFAIPTRNVVSLGSKAFYQTKYWNDWPDDSLVVNNGYVLGFKGNATSVVLPEYCKAIPNGMFEGMTSLTNVTVPAALEKVGSRAFAGSGIETVDFSGTRLTAMGVSAFEGCAKLRLVRLSPLLTAIPDDAFRECFSLTRIDVPLSVEAIGSSAFLNCEALVVFAGGEGVRTVGDFAFAGCVSLQTFRFPLDVSFGEHVFQFVRWTENVLLPSVGTMKQEYPATFKQIKTIVISASQTNIANEACAGCEALEWVKVPNGVRDVGERAFDGCSALTNLVLSATVSSVGSNAVKGCSSLVSLTTSGLFVFKTAFPDLANRLHSIRFAPGTVSLCSNVLSDCTALTAIEIPATVETIGYGAFANCIGLSPGITIPASVTKIGDFAFQNCTGLDIVRYMGEQPEVSTNIYAGTKRTLVSGVRRLFEESWTESTGSNATVRTLPKRWPGSQRNANSRRIAWWNGPSDKGEFAGKLTFYYYDATGNWQKMSVEDGLLVRPEREDYEFLGWFTKPYGGVRVTEANCAALGVTQVYAHWLRCGEDDPQSWDDIAYEVNRAHVYDGYLLRGSNTVAGTVRVSLARGGGKATAKFVLLGEGKSLTMKGKDLDVDETGGACVLRKGEREAVVNFSPNKMNGQFEGFNIVGARNIFGKKRDWEKRTARAALDDFGDAFSVVLRAVGDTPYAGGFVPLSVKVSSKGKAKVAGTLPDGTKVKVSSQLLVFEDRCILPVVVPAYPGKRGGLGFLIEGPKPVDTVTVVSEVAEMSSWVACSKTDVAFVSGLEALGVGGVGTVAQSSVFSMTNVWPVAGVSVVNELLPACVAVSASGKKWKLPKADKVRFVPDACAYEVLTSRGNPAGLKLSCSAKTGAFNGSFKVYSVTEQGRSKKFTAKVTGVVLDGVGYGTAVIKKVGSVPIVIAGAVQ